MAPENHSQNDLGGLSVKSSGGAWSCVDFGPPSDSTFLILGVLMPINLLTLDKKPVSVVQEYERSVFHKVQSHWSPTGR